jgi:tRNA(His) 5'-end guanylyltransferase
MNKGDSLGDRMKGYESVQKQLLTRRTPAIIRLDGKAFHTYTKRQLWKYDPRASESPFSEVMHGAMALATKHLVDNIQGAVFAYTQSDEISIFLRDWDTLMTQPWHNGNIQKIVSVSASLASVAFNHYLVSQSQEKSYPVNINELALFDSRVFTLPKEEVCNYFIWRQQDATRNSIQMLGHFHFSQKQMHGLNNSQVQDKLMLEKQINWNDLDVWKKRGTCVRRDCGTLVIDHFPPIFTQDRQYIEQYLLNEEADNGQC